MNGPGVLSPLSQLYVMIVDVNQSIWSVRGESWAFIHKISHLVCMAENLACRSQVVKQTCALDSSWSVCPSGLPRICGTACTGKVQVGDVSKETLICPSHELSLRAAVRIDWAGLNPWWISTSNPRVKTTLSTSSRPAGEPNKGGKGGRAAVWPSFEWLEGKIF